MISLQHKGCDLTSLPFLPRCCTEFKRVFKEKEIDLQIAEVMKPSSKNLYPSLLYIDLLTPETSPLFQRTRYILPAFLSVF